MSARIQILMVILFLVAPAPGKAAVVFSESFESSQSILQNGAEFNGIDIVPGLFGNCVRFQGSDTMAYSIPNFPAHQGTLVMWIKPRYNLEALESHTFLGFRETGPYSWDFAISDQWWESSSGKGLFYFVYQPLGLSRPNYSGNHIFWGNEWTQIAVVWSDSTTPQKRMAGLYINGVQYYIVPDAGINSDTIYQKPLSPPSGKVYVGSDPRKGRPAESDIDEIQIHDRILGATQIDSLYKAQLGSQWYHHRYMEWSDSVVSLPYTPERNAQGKILENRILLDEGSLFFSWGIDSILNIVERSGFNVYMPNMWHGSGAKIPSNISEFHQGYSAYYANGKDPFRDLITEAHKRGIEVHPWFCVTQKQNWPLHEEWAPPGTHYYGESEAFFDAHIPEFRHFIVNHMAEMALNYEIDGINLDYIRTGGISKNAYAIADYLATTGRDLNADAGLSVKPVEFLKWQAACIDSIVLDTRRKIKAVRPRAIISACVDPADEFDRNGDLTLNTYGRNPIRWLDSGWLDIALDMDYNQKLTLKFIDKACGLASTPRSWAKAIGDYDRVGTQVVPRDSMLTRIVTQYSQRKWPGTVAVYLLSMLDKNQQTMLGTGPFGEKALTDWSFVAGQSKISGPIRTADFVVPKIQVNQLAGKLQFKIHLPHNQAAELRIYDIRGRKIVHLVRRPGGPDEINWAPSFHQPIQGVYFALLKTDSHRIVKRFCVAQ